MQVLKHGLQTGTIVLAFSLMYSTANGADIVYVKDGITVHLQVDEIVSVSSPTVVTDDLIVRSSACVGKDCQGDEDFGFDTLILKSEDVRINFFDTSTSAAFPSQDWRIIANDSGAGGESYFAISDGNDPFGKDFRIDPGDNSFHIMADRIEVGTAESLRRLSNVAAGTAPNDAATIGQLQPVQDSLTNLLDAGTNQGVVLVGLGERMTAIEAGEAALETRISISETAIQDNAEAIAANTADIATLEVRVESNTTDIEKLSSLQVFAATGDGSETIANASATGTGSTAIGHGASARTSDTAVGYNATVTADGSVAVGAATLVESQNSVAVGADSQVAANAEGGIAIGQNARVLAGASSGVAIGRNSVVNEANTVSVGSAGNERRITNVAAGIHDTDAVTLGQLRSVVDIDRFDERLDDLEDQIDGVGAMASAFSALVPNPHDNSTTQLSLGVGHLSGATALAAGVFHYPSDNILLNTGLSSSFTNDTTAGRAGITIGW